MHVSLLSPASRVAGPALRPRHWPLFALSTAAALREDGHRLSFHDAHLLAPDPSARAAELLAQRPDLVLVYASDYNRQIPLAALRAQVEALRRQAPGLPLLLTGRLDPQTARALREALPEVDAVTAGEPEAAARSFLAGEGPGLLRAATDPLRVAPLAGLPEVPAWDLGPVQRYAFSPHQSGGDQVYPVLASRGCPFGCFYCEVRNQPRYAARPVDEVLREVRILRDRFGARSLFLADPMFALQRDETQALLRGLAPLGLRWSAMTRSDRVDGELLHQMARAGCWSLIFGVESLEAEVQRAARKDLDLSTIAPTLQAARAAGIETIVSVMVGLPGDDPPGVRRTLDRLIALEPDFAQFFAVRLEPRLSTAGGSLVPRERTSAFEFDGDQFVGAGFSGPEQLEALCREAYRRFYLRPRYLRRRLSAMRRRPLTELRRGVLGARLVVGRAAGRI